AHPSEAGAAGVWASPDGQVFLTTDRLWAFAGTCAGASNPCPPVATGALEGVPGAPIGAGESVVVATADGRLYAFRRADCGPGGACTPEWVGRTTTGSTDLVVSGETVILSQV